MPKQDYFGCDVSTDDAEALNQWNSTIRGFLAHASTTGDTLAAALKADPALAIAHACKGLFSLLLGRRELEETIHSAYASARECDHQNPVSMRERHYVAALGAWIEGKPSHAIEEMESVLKIWPHDALAMKLSQAIRFLKGDDRGMRKSLENIMNVYEGHPAEGYFLGCHAFTLEETGDYAKAEAQGRKALTLAQDDAWGLHAVSHVFDMTGRAREGLQWITGKDAAWAHCNNFRYHVWWHIALMHLDLGQHEKVLELYDAEIRKDKTDDYRDISNATSVLMRLEIEGVPVGSRWEELAELAAERTQDNCLAFADLHYMMALCGADNRESAAETLVSNMVLATQKHKGHEMAKVINHPGVIAARGLEAFRDHDFAGACRYLSQAQPLLQNIGGSHAQRDIFERIAIEAALRAGMSNEAQNLLHKRDRLRGSQDNYSTSRWKLLETAHSAGKSAVLGAA